MSVSAVSNKALVRRIFDEMWNQANPAAARKIFAEPLGVEQFVTRFLLAFPDIHHQVEEMIAEGDLVVARFHASGTHHGSWMGVPATYRPIRYTGVTIARLGGGKIVSHHTWWDALELFQQIKPPQL